MKDSHVGLVIMLTGIIGTLVGHYAQYWGWGIAISIFVGLVVWDPEVGD